MNLTETHILIKALSATQSPVTITDARLPDNPIIYCNDAFTKLTGYTKEDILGKNCRFLQGKDTDQPEVAKLRKDIKQEKDSSVILRNYTKDGKGFWNDLQVSPVYDDAGRLTHFIGLQIDVTERIERERALATTRQLEHEKKMLAAEKERLMHLNEIKDDFIAVASHQLRTPATAVKQYLGMVIDGMFGSLSDSQMKALDKAYSSNDRQLKIIDDLLKVARIDTGKITLDRQKVELTELLKITVGEFTYRLLDKHQTLKLRLPKEKVYASVDKELFRTGLENIIDNAVKYSNRAGEIVVSLKKLKSSLRISVKDQGIGISDADMEKIYRKFTRSNADEARNIGGTGLGLYWAKTVFDKHNAKLNVVSELGKGSTFSIDIPL